MVATASPPVAPPLQKIENFWTDISPYRHRRQLDIISGGSQSCTSQMHGHIFGEFGYMPRYRFWCILNNVSKLGICTLKSCDIYGLIQYLHVQISILVHLSNALNT